MSVYWRTHLYVLLHEGTNQHQISEQLVWSSCVIQGIVDYCRKTGSMKNLPHTGKSGCSTARDYQYLVWCSMTDRANVPQFRKTLAGSWHHSRVHNNSTMLQICWTACQDCLKNPLLMGHHPKLNFNSAKNTGIGQLWTDHLSSLQMKANSIYLTVVELCEMRWWTVTRWLHYVNYEISSRGGAIMVWGAITNVIQNNTGMYTKESLQQTFRIPSNVS